MLDALERLKSDQPLFQVIGMLYELGAGASDLEDLGIRLFLEANVPVPRLEYEAL
jgi:hypothetical protein